MSNLGLPETTRACLFDLDGVLTETASTHAAAWKQTFDQVLRDRAAESGDPFVPFDAAEDYLQHVDGKPRADGVRAFLASRAIVLPEGGPDDPPSAETVNGVGNRKNELLLTRIRDHGVDVFPGSRRYLEAVRARGLPAAVVSASANAEAVLEATGLDQFVDIRVDGVIATERGLAGKPAPDTFLAAADGLGVAPDAATVFEDALAGVAAGRAGRFGYVVGVDRVGQASALKAAGADIVVGDLDELLAPNWSRTGSPTTTSRSAWNRNAC